MALDARKRQRKLQRKNLKIKAKKRELARRPQGLTARIERSAAAPILHCCTTDILWDQGMSNVLVSRRLPAGSVAYVVFLVDVYCLGIKDVAMNVASGAEYEQRVFGHLFRNQRTVDLAPEAARKLVEGAVDFASRFGISPHRDYPKGKLIFGDIDASSCDEEFTYGKDGKPYYIAGPNDSPARQNHIIRLLEDRCGPDGYKFLATIDATDVPDQNGDWEEEVDGSDWEPEMVVGDISNGEVIHLSNGRLIKVSRLP